jgi:hypothetical protein
MAHRRSRAGFARTAAAALAFSLRAVASAAEPAGVPLAAPGACAEPRVALGATQQGDVAQPEALAADDFDLAGSPRHHFTPGDVALGGGGGPAAPPTPPGFTRDPCDAPLAGCSSILDAARGDVIVSEPPPGTGSNPGEQEGGGE